MSAFSAPIRRIKARATEAAAPESPITRPKIAPAANSKKKLSCKGKSPEFAQGEPGKQRFGEGQLIGSE